MIEGVIMESASWEVAAHALGEQREQVTSECRMCPICGAALIPANERCPRCRFTLCESCEGGPGHSFPQPTVRFCGQNDQGYRAVAIALAHGLRVDELRRCWSVINGELVGPQWEITFVRSEPTSPRR